MSVGLMRSRISPIVAAASVLTVLACPTPAEASVKNAKKCITRSDGVECAVIDSNGSKAWRTEYSRSFSNTLGKTVNFTCTETSSSSFSSQVSAGLKGEFKAWVFAKVEVSLGIALTWTWSASGTSSVGPVSVPNGWKYTCKFGTYKYSVNGHTTKYWSNGSVTRKNWSFMAPEDEKGWVFTKVRID